MVTPAPAIVVRGLRKAYGDVIAVDGLGLEVRNGECFGLLGPSGAGKTTTIEICEDGDRRDVACGELRACAETLSLALRA